jgi:hypothetical protein
VFFLGSGKKKKKLVKDLKEKLHTMLLIEANKALV